MEKEILEKRASATRMKLSDLRLYSRTYRTLAGGRIMSATLGSAQCAQRLVS